jgi:hypothetical protein
LQADALLAYFLTLQINRGKMGSANCHASAACNIVFGVSFPFKVSCPTANLFYTLAMLNIEPPEPKNSGSNADDPINLAHLLGMLHIVDLIC